MTEPVSTELITRLARYAGLRLAADRVEALSSILGPAVAQLRAMRPEGFENLAPDLNFRVPPPVPDDNER